MSEFTDGYKYFSSCASGYGARLGNAYIQNIETEIERLADVFNKQEGINTDAKIFKGDVAEFWHSGTHNIDAALKGEAIRTDVLRSKEFASPDIVDTDGIKYGLKYIYNGNASAKEQSISFFERFKKYERDHPGITFEKFLSDRNIDPDNVAKHDPIYSGQIRIVPSDQLQEAIKFLHKEIIHERMTRPELAHRYEETLENLTDKIKTSHGTESIALSKSEAEVLAGLAKAGKFDPKEFGLSAKDLINFEYVLKQAFKAGLTSATISAVLKIAPSIYKILESFIEHGEVDADKFKELGVVALSDGCNGFLRGSLSAAITATTKAGVFGELIKQVDPTIIGAATVIGLNVMQYSIRLGRNEINKGEFVDLVLRDLFVTTCSLTLGGVTQGLIEIPVIGFMIGSFVGSVAATFVYDRGYTAFLSYCCESGFTFFNLVDQNYELPDEILQEMGVEILAYEESSWEELYYETMDYEKLEIEELNYECLDITILRRGVIGVNKIGYIY